ncbi:AAEL014108-PA [Aedes aegypti]|uniref:Aquaporin n=2 Tax=Aedes aegypti TaxID=7159 RepID=Q16H85_AEDAE|nr:aquaporin-11 [Aedes aegypti]ANX14419.1 Aquaporin-6 [Aedes aegypti]EAT33473.1 AAEL014255-PA [Aedes aegypti]EAT33615.1 AAEL014108-PA [Aedes aegypti]
MAIEQLGYSVFFIALTSAIAAVARRVNDKLSKEGLVKELIFEAIAAAELCGCCFELIIVADNFGVATYAVFLFTLTIWWGLQWGNATACPYTYMEQIVQGEVSFKEAALKIWAQLMGGCCVYRYVQLYWWLEMAETHEGRAFEECAADLKVNLYLGAFIEGFATLCCRLASKVISEKDAKFGAFIDSFIGTSLVVAAFNYSGGYFNPVLATALKWGCAGNSALEHIIVYWIGSCAGAVLSVPLFKTASFRNMFLADKAKAE